MIKRAKGLATAGSFYARKGIVMYEVKIESEVFEEYSWFDTLVEAAAYLEEVSYKRATLKYIPERRSV